MTQIHQAKTNAIIANGLRAYNMCVIDMRIRTSNNTNHAVTSTRNIRALNDRYIPTSTTTDHIVIGSKNNADGMARTLEAMNSESEGLIYVNLVDFDQQFGHRNDVEGYAGALEQFDAWLPGFERRMSEQDLAILTADHGCDPTTPSTDHSREYV